MTNLRDYQLNAIDSVALGWETARRQLGIAATGSGKTVIMANVAKASDGPVLFLAHRTELIAQAMRTFGNWQADEYLFGERSGKQKVTFCTVQSARNANWLETDYSLILCDEAHHVASDEWQGVLSRWPNARILGVTATPSRTDARALGQYFERVAFEIGLLRLIHEGHLAPIRAKKLNLEVNIARLVKGNREVTVEENTNAISPLIEELARAVADEIWDRKTIVFLPRCDVSKRFAQALSELGVSAWHVAGTDSPKEKSEAIKAFARAGNNSALCNAVLLTEGFDCPSIDCVVVLRATKSKALYAQMVGRGTRTAQSKADCLILDPMWICGEIDLCAPADLTAPNVEHKRILQAKLDEGMTLTEAEAITVAEVEKALARKLDEAKKKQKAPRGTVDPLAYAVGIHDSDLQEYEPAMPWELEPPTAEQLARLEKLGFFCVRVTRGFAVKLIERLEKREKMGLATPKQVDVLRRFKIPSAETITKEQAGHLMQRLLRR